MGIERDLQDLLFCHDCVIVPQWGGFLTHYRPARLDEARRQVHPPGKDLSFNRHLVRNDGLLADHLAKREGIGFDVATARIDAEVAGWRETLDRSGRLELPHIGIFFRDAERNLQFDPDRRANYLRDAFGLRPLAAVPVERAKPEPVVIPLPAAQPIVVNEGRRLPVVWVAASIALVLVGTAAVWAYRSGAVNNTQWSGFFTGRSDSSAVYVAPSAASVLPVITAPMFELPEGDTGIRTLPIALNDTIHITVDLGRATSPAVADTTSVAIRPGTVADADLRFHVIGGCFAQSENADKLLEALITKGYPARRLRQRGLLHPVAFGSFATRSEALAMLKGLRAQDGRAAWLLVR